MKPREVFCIVLRSFGVWQLIAGLQEAAYFLPAVRQAYRMVEAQSGAYLVHALVCLVIACVLLQGAPLFANLVYREPAPETEIE